jgi:hypothetical protein
MELEGSSWVFCSLPLSQLNAVYNLTAYFFKICVSNTLPHVYAYVSQKSSSLQDFCKRKTGDQLNI